MSRSDLLNGQGRLSQCDNIVRDSELLNLILKHIKPCSLIATYFNKNNIHVFVSQVSLFASIFLFN